MEEIFLKEVFLRIAGENPMVQALWGGLFIALMNALGALLIYAWRRPSEGVVDTGLGFAAGVMLAASFTSLLLPGIEYGGLGPVLLGLALGVLFMDRADHLVPHFHQRFLGYEGTASGAVGVRVGLLLILAIAIHNVPEGFAVGVGFGSGEVGQGLALMLGIGLQNFPEGLASAAAALALGRGRLWFAAYTGIRAGLVELPAALLGALLVAWVAPLLPYAMGFAAGAMLYVVIDEVVPETHRKGYGRWATLATMVGAGVMLTLDVLLG